MREREARTILTPDEAAEPSVLHETLESTSVASVMSRTFPRASPQTGVDDLEWLFCHQDVCSVPVVGSSNRLLGIVTKSDLIQGRSDEQEVVVYREPSQRPSLPGDDEVAEHIGLHYDEELSLLAADVMTPALIVVEQQTSIGQAMTLMVFEGVSSLPVVVHTGRDAQIVGMVSSREVVHWLVERAGYLRELAQSGLRFAQWASGPPPRPLPTCETCSPRCADC